jgi:hypothetical protein
LGKYTVGWFDGAPGGNGFDNTASTNQYLYMQAAYLSNNVAPPNGPAEGISSILNWTAPSNGFYKFSGAFLPANNGTVGGPGTPYEGQSLVTFAIVNSLGGTNLAPQTAPQNNVPVSYSFNQTLSAGDIVQFQVGTAYQPGAAVGLSVTVVRTTNAILTLQTSTNLTSPWQNMPVTTDMITPSGELNVGALTNTNTFYRLKIRTATQQ